MVTTTAWGRVSAKEASIIGGGWAATNPLAANNIDWTPLVGGRFLLAIRCWLGIPLPVVVYSLPGSQSHPPANCPAHSFTDIVSVSTMGVATSTSLVAGSI